VDALDLAVVIVSWNVRERLRACLHALQAELARWGRRGAVWVVDNGSTDGTPAMIRQSFPQVRLIANEDNRGFAAANNQALRAMGFEEEPPVPEPSLPRYVLLLNPDTEVEPGAVSALVDFMDAHPAVGVAGVRLSYGDGSFQHSAFRFPGLWQIALDLLPVPGRLYGSRLNGRYPRRLYEAGRPFPIDHPLGAAMMVRREAILQVGLLDEGFFLYCEEIDWCWRMHRAGWSAYCVPEARVIHHVGQSAGQVRVASLRHLWRSRRRLYEKHYGPLRHRLARWLVRLGMAWQARATWRAVNRRELPRREGEERVRAYREIAALF